MGETIRKSRKEAIAEKLNSRRLGSEELMIDAFEVANASEALEASEAPKLTKSTLKRMLGHAKPYTWRVVLVCVVVIANAALGLVPSIATGKIVDEALVGGNMTLLIELLVIALLATAGNQLLYVCIDYSATWIGTRISHDLRTQLYAHLQRMQQAFFATEKQGDIITRMSSDTSTIGLMYDRFLSCSIDALATIVATLVALFNMSWQLAIVGILVVPLLVLPSRRAGKAQQRYASKVQEKTDEINQAVNETMSSDGSRMVKLLTLEDAKLEHFSDISDGYRSSRVRQTFSSYRFAGLMGTLSGIGPLLIYFVGGLLIINQLDLSLTVGTVTAMVALVGRLYTPVITLINMGVTIRSSTISFERVYGYIDRATSVASPENGLCPDMTCAPVRFEGVTFAYDSSWNVLRGVSFEVPGGKTYALVGKSGAGKTTTLDLIPRLHDPLSGRVLVAGVDVRDIDLAYLRTHIGVVSQDAFLFNGSIWDNLMYANPAASKEQVEEACRLAQINGFIERQPEGFDFVVGNRGSRLSGGERQRLSLAQVVLKDPDIIILDEATSALDSVTESAIQDVLDTLMEGRTAIIAAQRLNTVLKADRIMVLDEGVIMEEGTHEELLKKDGVYRKLFETQFACAPNAASGQSESLDIGALAARGRVCFLLPSDLPKVLGLMRRDRTMRMSLDKSGGLARVSNLMHGAPKGAVLHKHEFLGLFSKDDELMAAINLLYGYPDADSVFLPLFLTDDTLLTTDAEEDIVADIRDFVAARGYKRLLVDVSHENDEGRRFWQSHGFHPTEGLDDAGTVVVREL